MRNRPSPKWRARTVKDRGALLHRVADELVRRKAEIAHTITRENGKPLAQAEGEVLMSEDHLRWFAEEAKHAYGRLDPEPRAGQAPHGGEDAHRRRRGNLPVEFSAGGSPCARSLRPWQPAARSCSSRRARRLCPLSSSPSACKPRAFPPASSRSSSRDAVTVSGEFLNQPHLPQGQLHRLHPRRPGAHPRSGRAHQAALPRARRTGPRAGLRGLRPRPRRRPDHDRQIPQHRPVLHCGQPHLRAAIHLQGVRVALHRRGRQAAARAQGSSPAWTSARSSTSAGSTTRSHRSTMRSARARAWVAGRWNASPVRRASSCSPRSSKKWPPHLHLHARGNLRTHRAHLPLRHGRGSHSRSQQHALRPQRVRDDARHRPHLPARRADRSRHAGHQRWRTHRLEPRVPLAA